jgi:hypothetical protein
VDARQFVHASGVESSRSARWGAVVAATIVSTIALDLVATAAGTLLVASQLFDGAPPTAACGLLAVTYVLWIAALRINLVANWQLLERTGTSTNLLSKVAFELARRRLCGARVRRVASAVGYLATELGKEAPYYLGVAGTAALSDAVSATDAVVFLAGTNLGAAAYEFGLARLSRTVLDRVPPAALHPPAPGNPAPR